MKTIAGGIVEDSACAETCKAKRQCTKGLKTRISGTRQHLFPLYYEPHGILKTT